MTPREAMIHWCREREAVRLRQAAGAPAPWTDDPIIAKYRFCNVRREDDRVTRWIARNIREPYAGNDNLWFMLAIARWINWPDTLAELKSAGFGAWPDDTRFSLGRVADVLNRRRARKEKLFTGAYTINAPPGGGSKIDHVVFDVLGELWRDRATLEATLLGGPDNWPTLQSVHKRLLTYPGWGAFMAYQVVVDLRFTDYLRNAADVESWAAAGPGTIRGLNRIANRRTDFALDQSRALSEMRELWRTIRDDTGVAMDFSDIPNVMCETDKFLRVLNGEGAPRALYIPSTEPMP